jgi:purine-cytosine permease-like protein
VSEVNECKVSSAKVLQIEEHCINIIPTQERYGTPKSLFWIWLISQLTISAVIMGQLFTVLGLSVAESLVISAFLALTFVLIGICGIPGAKTGTTAMVISRASFGVRGNFLSAILSWLILIGWESVAVVLTVDSILTLAGKFGMPSTGTGTTLVVLVIALILTFTVPILGYAALVVFQRYLAYIVGILTIVMAIVILPHVNWGFAPSVSQMAAKGLIPTLFLAASIGLAATSLGWSNYAADYTRYFPKNTSTKAIVWYTALGGGIATFVFLSVGVLLGSFVNPTAFSNNPMAAMAGVLPGWFVVPFMISIILGQVANNYMNSYSSALTFVSMGIHMKRHYSVIVNALICIVIVSYALFMNQGFVSFFEQFLSLSIIWIGPWTAIFIVNHWVNRGEYRSEDLLSFKPTGVYWFTSGVHWQGMIALVLGGFAAFMCINSSLWVSPLSTYVLLGADISAFVGPLVAGLVYAACAKRTYAAVATGVRQQVVVNP